MQNIKQTSAAFALGTIRDTSFVSVYIPDLLFIERARPLLAASLSSFCMQLPTGALELTQRTHLLFIRVSLKISNNYEMSEFSNRACNRN